MHRNTSLGRRFIGPNSPATTYNPWLALISRAFPSPDVIDAGSKPLRQGDLDVLPLSDKHHVMIMQHMLASCPHRRPIALEIDEGEYCSNLNIAPHTCLGGHTDTSDQVCVFTYLLQTAAQQ